MSLFNSLLLVIADAIQRELARQFRFLKVENEVLRSKLPARITVTYKERQHLCADCDFYGRDVGSSAIRGRSNHRIEKIVHLRSSILIAKVQRSRLALHFCAGRAITTA